MPKLKILAILLAIPLLGAACAKKEASVFYEPESPMTVVEPEAEGEESMAVADTFDASVPEEATVTLKTSMGDIVIELFGKDAPKTVKNFLTLAESDFYNGVTFHRVIPDFMIQGGDPLSKDADPENDGTGGPGYFFEDEINSHNIVRGALAMANAGPGTNGSQFFIVTTEAAPWLDGKHTVFGRVTAGMDVVDAIAAVGRDARDRPTENVVIEGVLVE